MSVVHAVLLLRVFLKLRKTLLILYFLRPDLLHLAILNWRRSNKLQPPLVLPPPRHRE